MNNELKSRITTIVVKVISSIAGFVNGLWVVFAGASYFQDLSPYSALGYLIPREYRHLYFFFFWNSPMILLIAPLLGALLGTLIGFCINLLFQRERNPKDIKTGAIFGGITGFLSLGAMFLNIFAS